VAEEPGAGGLRQASPGTGTHDGKFWLDWMPDGKLVFTSSIGDFTHIWSMGADGSARTQLTHEGRLNLWPSASRDGKSIVFVSDRSGKFHIWRMDADGGNPRELTHGELDLTPDISPDGSWMVFRAMVEDKERVLRVSAEGGEASELTPAPGAFPRISPDGKWITFLTWEQGEKRYRRAIIPAAGGPVKRFEGIGAEIVDWASDSRALLYRQYQDGADNLWLSPLDGRKPKQVTNFTSGRFGSWAWSHDFGRLALARGSRNSDVVLVSSFR
jgi:Tol biopolymer transport system component